MIFTDRSGCITVTAVELLDNNPSSISPHFLAQFYRVMRQKLRNLPCQMGNFVAQQVARHGCAILMHCAIK